MPARSPAPGRAMSDPGNAVPSSTGHFLRFPDVEAVIDLSELQKFFRHR